MFSILAKLGLDATGFQIGLKRAESGVSKFSKDIGSSLKGQIASAFGAAAITAGIQQAISKAS